MENRQHRRKERLWEEEGQRFGWGWKDWVHQESLALLDLSWSLLFTKLHQRALLGCGDPLCLALLKVMAAREGQPRWWGDAAGTELAEGSLTQEAAVSLCQGPGAAESTL